MLPPSHDVQNDAVQLFSSLRHRYVVFAAEIKRILEDALGAADIKFHAVESRAKTVDSFDSKCRKANSTGSPKYVNPMSEITDLAGARIITYTLDDVERACAFLDQHFDVQEKKDLGDERSDEGRFGYQSIHYLCKLNGKRLELPEFAQFKGIVCEIQVRTVLQHVWAQLEHGMQYKASNVLPKSIKKKFTSLAGLLEIGDREFQSIESEFGRLKEAVRLDFADDLTKEAFGRNENSKTDSQLPHSSAGPREVFRVRDLVSEGRYLEAIQAYDAKIGDQPKSVTLYLGRAMAKFLTGDSFGAEKDIEVAEALQPGHQAVMALRERIIEGNLTASTVVSDASRSNDLTNLGHEAMKAGDGELAYMRYSEALDAGASRPFSTFNRAMACILADDLAGSLNLLGGLQIRSGTPMEINILALKAILNRLAGEEADSSAIDDLQQAVSLKGDFSFQLSPLNILQAGLLVKFGPDKLRELNSILEKVGGRLVFP